ncbi:MAG: hypothetical protein CMJ83_16855 [Planctomycetes bacterium]|nr:hypothetical protein [Planctomycetota bacterium]
MVGRFGTGVIVLTVVSATVVAQPEWAQRMPETVPPGTHLSAAATDTARGRVVMFGGSALFGTTSVVVSDTWEWDGVTWLARNVSPAPSARSMSAMAYDAARQRTVLFGGGSPTGATLGDTWEWDGTNWTSIAPPITPPARMGHAMAYDPGRQRIVMFGGSPASTAPALGDTWEWDGVTWTQVFPATSPAPRQDHRMALSPSGNVLMVGRVGPASSVETWEYDGTNWLQFAPGAPIQARIRHGLAYDSSTNQTVLFGGYCGLGVADTHRWNGSSWDLFATSGDRPPGRWGHVLSADPTGGGIVMFGGGFPHWRDTWSYTLIPQSAGIGQPNSDYAWFDIAGAGWLGHSGPGPFIGTVAAGGPVTLAFRSSMTAPFVLAAGPANPANATSANGILDIGMPPFYPDVVVLLDGLVDPNASTSIPFSATSPSLNPVFTRHITLVLGAALAGSVVNLQAVVIGPPPVLTAAYYVTIL